MKDPLVYIEDILVNLQRIQGFLAGVSKDEFMANVEKQYAVIRALEIMGEAVKKLPSSLRNEHPEVPWKEIAASRDVLIHDYGQINLEIVWRIVTEDLPPLKKQLEQLIG